MSAGFDGSYASKRGSAVALALSRVRRTKAIAQWRDLLARLLTSYHVSCLRRLLMRSFYPSVRAVRLGQATGIDGLFLAIFASQFVLETGALIPRDMSLTDLAMARAEVLPRALARRDVRLLVEQHIVARLHVLLSQGNYYVETWIRTHHRNPWVTFVRSTMARIGLRGPCERDPVTVFRLDPDEFSAFVWKRFWAIPELENVLDSAVPATEPAQFEDRLDSEPVTTAVKVATSLDTDHPGWAQPEKLLRELHEEIRAANTLAPDHALIRHVLHRVEQAVKRLGDFEAAYEIGTTQDPLPEWVNAALDVVDSAECQQHGADSATKLVRRISCRLWLTGMYRFPAAQKPSITAKSEPPDRPPVATIPLPHSVDYEVDTGF
jgi:hypothetical protein